MNEELKKFLLDWIEEIARELHQRSPKIPLEECRRDANFFLTVHLHQKGYL